MIIMHVKLSGLPTVSNCRSSGFTVAKQIPALLLIFSLIVKKNKDRTWMIVGNITLTGQGHICLTVISAATAHVLSLVSQSYPQSMSHLMFVAHPWWCPSASNSGYVLGSKSCDGNDTFYFRRLSAVLFGPHIIEQRDDFNRIHTETPGVLDWC